MSVLILSVEAERRRVPGRSVESGVGSVDDGRDGVGAGGGAEENESPESDADCELAVSMPRARFCLFDIVRFRFEDPRAI